MGRDDELAVIAGMLGGAGGSGLLLVGEPGAGKSALLHAAASLAARDGRAVLRAAGCRPRPRCRTPGSISCSTRWRAPRSGSRAGRERCCEPRSAMPTGRCLTCSRPRWRRSSSGRGRGRRRRVVADDLHWMDDATLGVLRFVARRIASGPVALLAAIRHGFEDVLVEADMPIVMVRPLRIAEARAPLRHAHQVCEAHGLLPWAERARQELRATGEGRATLRPRRGRRCRRKNCRSPGWPPRDCRTGRSDSGCTSRTGPSARTSTGSSRSLASARARSWDPRWPRPAPP